MMLTIYIGIIWFKVMNGLKTRKYYASLLRKTFKIFPILKYIMPIRNNNVNVEMEQVVCLKVFANILSRHLQTALV